MAVKAAISSDQVEELVDELNLMPNIVPIYPPSLALPDHVDGFVALNRSPGCLEFSESLFRFHAPLDRSVILLQDIV